MTRKDYVLIAEIIKNAGAANAMDRGFATGAESAREYIANAFAAHERRHNERFDERRFFEACGLEHLV